MTWKPKHAKPKPQREKEPTCLICSSYQMRNLVPPKHVCTPASLGITKGN
jgi:hypothetical protein